MCNEISIWNLTVEGKKREESPGLKLIPDYSHLAALGNSTTVQFEECNELCTDTKSVQSVVRYREFRSTI